MYALRLMSSARPAQQVRLVSFYPALRDSKPVATHAKVEEPGAGSAPASGSGNSSVFGPRMVTPDKWDRKVLVWMKKYKSVDDIPEKITYEAFDSTQNRFRIRIANIMMVATILGTIFAVWSGKKRAEHGDNLEQINLDWHKQIKEDYHANLAKEAAKNK